MQIEERQNDDDWRLSHYPKANAASRLDEQTLDSKLDSLDLALKLTSLIGGDGGRDDGT